MPIKANGAVPSHLSNCHPSSAPTITPATNSDTTRNAADMALPVAAPELAAPASSCKPPFADAARFASSEPDNSASRAFKAASSSCLWSAVPKSVSPARAAASGRGAAPGVLARKSRIGANRAALTNSMNFLDNPETERARDRRTRPSQTARTIFSPGPAVKNSSRLISDCFGVLISA